MTAVVIDNQPQRGGGVEPVVAGEFALDLTRSPARVAERKEALHRAPTVPDVAQNLPVRRHRHASIDIEGLVEVIFGAVDDKTELLLHRPAGKDLDTPRNARDVLAGPFQQARDRTLADRSVDDDPESALPVVPHHQDDGMREAGIAD